MCISQLKQIFLALSLPKMIQDATRVLSSSLEYFISLEIFITFLKISEIVRQVQDPVSYQKVKWS